LERLIGTGWAGIGEALCGARGVQDLMKAMVGGVHRDASSSPSTMLQDDDDQTNQQHARESIELQWNETSTQLLTASQQYLQHLPADTTAPQPTSSAPSTSLSSSLAFLNLDPSTSSSSSSSPSSSVSAYACSLPSSFDLHSPLFPQLPRSVQASLVLLRKSVASIRKIGVQIQNPSSMQPQPQTQSHSTVTPNSSSSSTSQSRRRWFQIDCQGLEFSSICALLQHKLSNSDDNAVQHQSGSDPVTPTASSILQPLSAISLLSAWSFGTLVSTGGSMGANLAASELHRQVKERCVHQ